MQICIYDLINSRANLPEAHSVKFEKYIVDSKELEKLIKKEKKVPLNRSTITFVGQGRSGKTYTINSLKKSSFQHHCPSTRGSRTSEVHVRDLGMIRVSNIEANNTFCQKERDAKSTARSLCTRLDETTTDYEQYHHDEEECKGLVERRYKFNKESVSKLRSIQLENCQIDTCDLDDNSDDA